MPNRDVIAQIQAFNADRDRSLLMRKYKAMAENSFAFLRGSCHLFDHDLPAEAVFQKAPSVWLCGDLHLQNFGSFKGDDRLVYFDINDFDEAILSPCTWDIARFLTSLIVGAHTLNVDDEEAQALCQCFLEAYTAELATGKDRTVHRESSTGLVKELLEGLRKRDRKAFLNERTTLSGKTRSLKMIPNKTFAATEEEKAAVTSAIETWADPKESKFYRVLDVAHRIAGTGSLGLPRYIILVEGKGSPHGNYVLDLKAARSSSLQPYAQQLCPTVVQPQWKSEADRITAIQYRVQESAPALLNPLKLDGKSLVLRELQPTADRVDLQRWNGKIKRLKKVVQTMAQVTAWGQLRSSGRQTSAIADELIDFALSASEWQPEVLEYARSYAVQVETDFKVFSEFVASSKSAE